MSALIDPLLPCEKLLVYDLKIVDLPSSCNEFNDDNCNTKFTPIVDCAEVPWRFGFKKYSENNILKIGVSVHCHCDSRSFFMVTGHCRVSLVHREHAERTVSLRNHFTVQSNTDLFSRLCFFNLLDIEPLAMGFLNPESDTYTLRFELTVTDTMSASLKPPMFTPDCPYSDVCIRTTDRDFYVSRNILQNRVRAFNRSRFASSAAPVSMIIRDKTIYVWEFLKLVYFYQDDINRENVNGSLKLAKKYGADDVMVMLKKYILRTDQIKITEKALLAKRFRWNDIYKLLLASIPTTQSAAESRRLIPNYFSRVPIELRQDLRRAGKRPPLLINRDSRIDGVMNFKEHQIPNRLYVKVMTRYKAFGGVELRAGIMCPSLPEGQMKKFLIDITAYHGSEDYFKCNVSYAIDFYSSREQMIVPFVDDPLNQGRVVVPNDGGRVAAVGTTPFYVIRREATLSSTLNSFTVTASPLVWPDERLVKIQIRVQVNDLKVSSDLFPREDLDFKVQRRHSNAKLLIGNERLFVDKEILSIGSALFQRMFQGSYNQRSTYRLKIEGCSYTDVEKGLQHLYQGGRSIRQADSKNLHKFSRKIGSDRLHQDLDIHLCRQYKWKLDSKLFFAKYHLFTNLLLLATYEIQGEDGIRKLGRERLDYELRRDQGQPAPAPAPAPEPMDIGQDDDPDNLNVRIPEALGGAQEIVDLEPPVDPAPIAIPPPDAPERQRFNQLALERVQLVLHQQEQAQLQNQIWLQERLWNLLQGQMHQMQAFRAPPHAPPLDPPELPPADRLLQDIIQHIIQRRFPQPQPPPVPVPVPPPPPAPLNHPIPIPNHPYPLAPVDPQPNVPVNVPGVDNVLRALQALINIRDQPPPPAPPAP